MTNKQRQELMEKNIQGLRKAQERQVSYAKFQAKRIHNTVNQVLPEGARHVKA